MIEVTNTEELYENLKKSLKQFLEDNESFNVQGSWTGEDGLTVSVLVDFGIEDRDTGEYYVGSVSARHQDNLELLEDREEAELGEMSTFREAEDAMFRAIASVLKVRFHDVFGDMRQVSDIDTHNTAVIDWKHPEIRDFVDVPEEAEI